MESTRRSGSGPCPVGDLARSRQLKNNQALRKLLRESYVARPFFTVLNKSPGRETYNSENIIESVPLKEKSVCYLCLFELPFHLIAFAVASILPVGFSLFVPLALTSSLPLLHTICGHFQSRICRRKKSFRACGWMRWTDVYGRVQKVWFQRFCMNSPILVIPFGGETNVHAEVKISQSIFMWGGKRSASDILDRDKTGCRPGCLILRGDKTLGVNVRLYVRSLFLPL